MKKTLTFIIFILGLNISFWFTCNGNWGAEDESQKPPICDQTPKVIDQILEDETYVINLLKNSSDNKDAEWLGSKALGTVVWAYKTSEQVFTDFWTDFFSNFKTLFEDKYIVRDWTKLLWFKQYISTKVLDSIQKKSLNQLIDKDTLEKIKEYTKEKDTFVLEFNATTYQEAYNYLRTNHQALESSFYNTNIKWDANYEVKWKINSKSVIFKPNQEHLEKINNEIKKAYFINWAKPSCNNTWDEFIKKVKEVVCKYGKKKTDNALDRFSCNYKRLRNALYWEQNDVAWCGTTKLAPFVPLDQRVKFEWMWKIQKMAEEMKNFADKAKAIWKEVGEMMKTKKVSSQMWIVVDQQPTEIAKNRLITNLWDSSSDILRERDSATKMFTNIESSRYTQHITTDIVKLSHKNFDVRVKVDNDDGTAWEYDESAAWYATQACLNQSPYVWDCKNGD